MVSNADEAIVCRAPWSSGVAGDSGGQGSKACTGFDQGFDCLENIFVAVLPVSSPRNTQDQFLLCSRFDARKKN